MEKFEEITEKSHIKNKKISRQDRRIKVGCFVEVIKLAWASSSAGRAPDF